MISRGHFIVCRRIIDLCLQIEVAHDARPRVDGDGAEVFLADAPLGLSGEIQQQQEPLDGRRLGHLPDGDVGFGIGRKRPLMQQDPLHLRPIKLRDKHLYVEGGGHVHVFHDHAV